MAITLVSSTSGNANNGGTVTLTFSPVGITGDYIVVTATWGSTAGTITCTTSSGGAYTGLVATFAGAGNSRTAVFGTRVSTATNLATQAIVAGSGRSSDSTIVIGQIFRGVSTAATPTDASATTATGTSTSPNSPAITGANPNDAVLTCVGVAVNSAPTVPTGYTGIGVNQTDTNPSGCGQAWSLIYKTTSSQDPPAWGATSAGWGAATVLLSEQKINPLGGIDAFQGPDLTRIDIVGY